MNDIELLPAEKPIKKRSQQWWSIDTGGPLGRAVVVIVGAIAELERNLIVDP